MIYLYPLSNHSKKSVLTYPIFRQNTFPILKIYKKFIQMFKIFFFSGWNPIFNEVAHSSMEENFFEPSFLNKFF